MFSKKTIHDIDIHQKVVLLRADYNVPANEDGTIADDYRIRQSLPTIHALLDKEAKVVIISHRGRPENVGEYDPKTSLKPVAERLGELLGREVQFAEDCIGEKAEALARHMENGHILVLENVRYHEEEEQNSSEFAGNIVTAVGAEVFVQDGFGVVHRAHSTTDAIARTLIPAVAGLLLAKEVDTITNVMQDPKRPLMVIVGGAKISDKIEILNKFIDIANTVAVVGALANTFLLAMGHAVGASLAEPNDVQTAKDILARAHEKASRERFHFIVPRDVVVAKDMTNTETTRIVDLSHNTWADIESYPKKPETNRFEIAPDEKILDVGPFTASYIAGFIRSSETVIWNGTAGVTEVKGLSGAADPFAHGTKIIVDAMLGEPGEVAKPFVVVGGGDTVAYVESQGDLREHLGHVSTGGGASLELMAGKDLPGVAVLENKE